MLISVVCLSGDSFWRFGYVMSHRNIQGHVGEKWSCAAEIATFTGTSYIAELFVTDIFVAIIVTVDVAVCCRRFVPRGMRTIYRLHADL